MPRGSYRDQGSDQAVRIIFRPGLGVPQFERLCFWGFATLGVALLELIEARYSHNSVTLGVTAGQSPPWFTAALALSTVVAAGFLKKAFEVVVDHDVIKLRTRTWPLLWREQRLGRYAVERVLIDDDFNGVFSLSMQIQGGATVPLFENHPLDRATASNLKETIERALDPEEIETLADEHRQRQTP